MYFRILNVCSIKYSYNNPIEHNFKMLNIKKKTLVWEHLHWVAVWAFYDKSALCGQLWDFMSNALNPRLIHFKM